MYPLGNSQGCTKLETYYSGGMKRDAEILNIGYFLVIVTVFVFSLWKAGWVRAPHDNVLRAAGAAVGPQ